METERGDILQELDSRYAYKWAACQFNFDEQQIKSEEKKAKKRTNRQEDTI